MLVHNSIPQSITPLHLITTELNGDEQLSPENEGADELDDLLPTENNKGVSSFRQIWEVFKKVLISNIINVKYVTISCSNLVYLCVCVCVCVCVCACVRACVRVCVCVCP